MPVDQRAARNAIVAAAGSSRVVPNSVVLVSTSLFRAAANPDRSVGGRQVDDGTVLSDVHLFGCDQSSRCRPRIVHELAPLFSTDDASGIRRTDRRRECALSEQFHDRFFETRP